LFLHKINASAIILELKLPPQLPSALCSSPSSYPSRFGHLRFLPCVGSLQVWIRRLKTSPQTSVIS
ncbi:hypothetical protein LINPERHAP2_LOCUS23017, partial [Linum perenne]